MTKLATSTIPVLVLALLPGCSTKPTKYDVYMEGLQIEGEAERGPCRLAFDGAMQAQVLSGDKVQDCLARTEEALAKYEEAGAMGMDSDIEFQQTHQRALDRKKNLESMLHQIRRLERDQVIHDSSR